MENNIIGKRISLVEMKINDIREILLNAGQWKPINPNSVGTVYGYDGTIINVHWNNGRICSIIEGVDKFVVLDDQWEFIYEGDGVEYEIWKKGEMVYYVPIQRGEDFSSGEPDITRDFKNATPV